MTQIPINTKNIWYTVVNHYGRTNSKNSCRPFEGVCLDTGAQRSVIGKPQAQAYCRQHSIDYRSQPSKMLFRFGDGTFPSLAMIRIRIPTPNKIYLHLLLNLVAADVPFLIGLDVLDRES